jgi:hypothetical protein
MEDLCKSYKKEAVKKKQAGELDENDSDPITFPLFRLICQWALGAGNIFLWVFGLLQWNCMGRSISIDPLGFRNFTMGSDSIKCTTTRTARQTKQARKSRQRTYTQILWIQSFAHLRP